MGEGYRTRAPGASVEVLQIHFHTLFHPFSQRLFKGYPNTTLHNTTINMSEEDPTVNLPVQPDLSLITRILNREKEVKKVLGSTNSATQEQTYKYPKTKEAYDQLLRAHPLVARFFAKVKEDEDGHGIPTEIPTQEELQKTLEILEELLPEIQKLDQFELDKRCAQQLQEARARVEKGDPMNLVFDMAVRLVSSSLSKTCLRTDIGEQTYWAESSLKTSADGFIYGGFNELIEDIHLADARRADLSCIALDSFNRVTIPYSLTAGHIYRRGNFVICNVY